MQLAHSTHSCCCCCVRARARALLTCACTRVPHYPYLIPSCDKLGSPCGAADVTVCRSWGAATNKCGFGGGMIPLHAWVINDCMYILSRVTIAGLPWVLYNLAVWVTILMCVAGWCCSRYCPVFSRTIDSKATPTARGSTADKLVESTW